MASHLRISDIQGTLSFLIQDNRFVQYILQCTTALDLGNVLLQDFAFTSYLAEAADTMINMLMT